MRAMTTKPWLGLMLAAAVLPAGSALAQSTAAPPPAAQAPSAQPPDTVSIWTLQDENAAVTTAELTDRYYTNGLRLGWTSPENAAPGFLEDFGKLLWGEGRMRVAFDLTQQIYTPDDDNDPSGYPPLTDRPFAGVLMGTGSLIHDGANARSVFSVGLGVVGPAALAQSVQNNFHNWIDQYHTSGWSTQLHDEPLLEITSQRTWRLPVATVGGLDTDALPEITAAAGNLRIYAQTGVTLRIGQGLDSDYGTARMLPGLTGTDVFRPTRPFAWYVFVGADGQGVARDLTLQGNTWQDSRSVKIKNAVAEFQGGLALMAYGARATFTDVAQTQEFKHQKGGLHQFGSLALSVRF
jgi:hypothetical protein